MLITPGHETHEVADDIAKSSTAEISEYGVFSAGYLDGRKANGSYVVRSSPLDLRPC